MSVGIDVHALPEPVWRVDHRVGRPTDARTAPLLGQRVRVLNVEIRNGRAEIVVGMLVLVLAWTAGAPRLHRVRAKYVR
jgi:hypothetical protein